MKRFESAVAASTEGASEGSPKIDLLVRATLEMGARAVERIRDSRMAESVRLDGAKRLAERTATCLKRLTQISAIAALGLAVNHERTAQEVTETRDESGMMVYTHADPTTTHILNCLTGRETLSEKERFEIFRLSMKESWQSHGVVLPDNYDDLEYEDFVSFYERMFVKELRKFGDAEARHREAEDQVRLLIDLTLPSRLFSLSGFDPRMYRAIWMMEKEVGAPKIRWNDGIMPTAKGTSGRPYYNPFSHTLYIRPVDARSDLAAEAAHSLQFRSSPVDAYLMGAETGLRMAGRIADELAKRFVTLGKASGENADLNGLYAEEYARPGSYEHDAHEKIEPDLKKRFLDSAEHQQ